MNTMLIDDEPAANSGLRQMLNNKHPEIRIIGEATNAREGLVKIRQLRPDLLFLDIEMPGGTGFDLIRQLGEDERPEIVFVTSRDEYAFQAFNCAVLDYVLKPVEPQALATAVARAGERLHQKTSAHRLETLLSNMDNTVNLDRKIGIPNDSGVEFVKAGEIVCCEGFKGYTLIHLTNGTNRTSSYPIGRYKKILPAPEFFMTHRSFLVNREQVTRINQATLDLKNGMSAEISRRRKKLVEKWLS